MVIVPFLYTTRADTSEEMSARTLKDLGFNDRFINSIVKDMVAMKICMMPCVFSFFRKLNIPSTKPANPKITGKIKNDHVS